MKKIIGILGLLCLPFYALESAIFHEIDTTRPLKCIFSSIHQNRIAVDKGRVEKVIFTDDSLAVRMEEESGQAFICVAKPLSRETTLSIVTGGSYVQDLEILFQDRHSEVVILKEPIPSIEEPQESELCSFPILGDIIREIMQGKVPEGYSYYPLPFECTKLGRGLLIESMAQLEGQEDTIYIYKITNTRWRASTLCEQDLCFPGASWVYLGCYKLGFKKETTALVSFKRG